MKIEGKRKLNVVELKYIALLQKKKRINLPLTKTEINLIKVAKNVTS